MNINRKHHYKHLPGTNYIDTKIDSKYDLLVIAVSKASYATQHYWLHLEIFSDAWCQWLMVGCFVCTVMHRKNWAIYKWTIMCLSPLLLLSFCQTNTLFQYITCIGFNNFWFMRKFIPAIMGKIKL